MNTERVCKECGASLSGNTPEGLCPKCLMKIGLGSETGREGKAGNTLPDIEEIRRLFPQFEILEFLGRGGMGVVYKARQPQLDRVVALKILPPEAGRDPAFAERFAREARALARLNHPNIVSVYDSGQSNGLYYFVMEYVDGVNLRQMLQAGHMAPKEALAIVPKVCDALQYAHDEGIMHRDIKPENILFDKKGRVKIADFGLAKLLGHDADDITLTAHGMTMGTPKYMSPEQMENPTEVDHRADIYSLGVVFYEMLTGELPLGRFEPPSKKVQIDVRLDEVVLRTLEKEPERRYQHVSELKGRVEDITSFEQLPKQLQVMLGYEYKSPKMVLGMPLVHIVSGIDPKTKKIREAHGFFAMGPKARGIVACGGKARGVIAFGGIAIGLFAFGGVGIGIVGLGGLAIGLLGYGGLVLALILGIGGFAVAPIAMGGFALGYYAEGGFVIGQHVYGGNARYPEGKEFFKGWGTPLMTWMWIVCLFFSVVFPIITIAVNAKVRKKIMQRAGGSTGETSG